MINSCSFLYLSHQQCVLTTTEHRNSKTQARLCDSMCKCAKILKLINIEVACSFLKKSRQLLIITNCRACTMWNNYKEFAPMHLKLQKEYKMHTNQLSVWISKEIEMDDYVTDLRLSITDNLLTRTQSFLLLVAYCPM